MATALSEVHWWWRTPDGVGHVVVITANCTCGRCDRWIALCGLRGRDGERTRYRPDRDLPSHESGDRSARRADSGWTPRSYARPSQGIRKCYDSGNRNIGAPAAVRACTRRRSG